jgi:uncharacterized protein YndB with AHSA1/START domain
VDQRTSFDWSNFRVGVFINGVQPDEVYTLWATSDGLTRWFLREADFAPSEVPRPRTAHEKRRVPPFEDLVARPPHERCQTNDRYRWEWYYDGGIRGEHWIIDARPPSKLVFGFGDDMSVEVTMRKQGSACEVALRQFDIPTTLEARHDVHMGCRVGWTFLLTNLKSFAEGGLDLRETDGSRARQLHLVNI